MIEEKNSNSTKKQPKNVNELDSEGNSSENTNIKETFFLFYLS